MPKIKLTKSAIDALTPSDKDEVFWDTTLPGFGIKVTPKGRKVFVALYRVRGGGSRLRKYTIGPYGKLTLHHARATAQRVFAARTEGRDLAAEKLEQRRREVADRVDELLEKFVAEHLSTIRSGKSIARQLRREVIPAWGIRSIHDIKRRDIGILVADVAAQRTPYAAHRQLKLIKVFFSWCLGRGILESSPAIGFKSGFQEVSRDRFLDDDELVQVILAARELGESFGAMIEFLALTGQRREEVNQMTWDELDLRRQVWTLPAKRTKNGRPHIVHMSSEALAIITRQPRCGPFVFSKTTRPFQAFNRVKPRHDTISDVHGWVLHDLRRTCVSGMARLGIAPQVADKVLNHQSGTISGVAAVYQRHEFLAERKDALIRWGAHVRKILSARVGSGRNKSAERSMRTEGCLVSV